MGISTDLRRPVSASLTVRDPVDTRCHWPLGSLNRHCQIDEEVLWKIEISEDTRCVAVVWNRREGISARALGERSALKNSRMSKSATLGNQHAPECARKLRAGRPQLHIKCSKKLLTDPRDDCVPIPLCRLPKESHVGVPRTVLAVPHPSEIWHIGKKHPNWYTQSTRQMGYAGIDGDHKVKLRNQSRRVRKVPESCRVVSNPRRPQ